VSLSFFLHRLLSPAEIKQKKIFASFSSFVDRQMQQPMLFNVSHGRSLYIANVDTQILRRLADKKLIGFIGA
jgi:hypothetical protein